MSLINSLPHDCQHLLASLLCSRCTNAEVHCMCDDGAGDLFSFYFTLHLQSGHCSERLFWVSLQRHLDLESFPWLKDWVKECFWSSLQRQSLKHIDTHTHIHTHRSRSNSKSTTPNLKGEVRAICRFWVFDTRSSSHTHIPPHSHTQFLGLYEPVAFHDHHSVDVLLEMGWSSLAWSRRRYTMPQHCSLLRGGGVTGPPILRDRVTF